MKKRVKIVFAFTLLAISLCLTNNTYSRYIADSNGDVDIEFAKWQILVNNDVIAKLELKDIEALHVRAEDLAFDKKYRESFDIAVSRAVANLTTLVEYMIPFVKIGGKIICMKGPGLQEELKDAQNAIKLLGGEVEAIETLNIGNEYERNILIINKVKSTNMKYPRKQGKPLKEPLK